MPVLRSAVQGFRDEGAAEVVVEADPRHHGADDAMTVLFNIDVPDVEAATTFYTAAFGLTVGRRFGSDFVELKGWPAPVYLLTKQAGTLGAGGDRRRYDRHWTPLHLDVVVDDVDEAVARALRAGAILEAPARDAPYGRIAMLADPFGHGFCLLAFSALGYDALLP
jgi:predicted enzyme related to lactoylglutathione lyase